MEITAKALAHLLKGTVEGNPDVTVNRPSKIEEGEVGTICFLGNAQYEHYAYTTKASILLVANDFVAQKPIAATLVRVENVYSSLAFLMEAFGKQQVATESQISKLASIQEDVTMGKNAQISDFTIIKSGTKIGDNAVISAQVYIGNNVTIGDNAYLHAGVKIYSNTVIGNNFIAQANAVIGSDGFGFAPQADGSYKKIHHAGNVIIEDDVEIGASTTIDRGSLGSTRIGKGVKLDNLVQVAHNVEIGENTVIAAQTGIAGSTKIGKNNRIGGQVGFGGHLQIGDNVEIQGQTGVISNVANGAKLYGNPQMNFRDFLRSYAIFRKLPDMLKRLEKLEK